MRENEADMATEEESGMRVTANSTNWKRMDSVDASADVRWHSLANAANNSSRATATVSTASLSLYAGWCHVIVASNSLKCLEC